MPPSAPASAPPPAGASSGQVEDVIHREAKGARAEALATDLADHLDAPNLDDDIATRPIAEVCDGLGLGALPFAPPSKRRTAADICARAAACRATAQHPAAPRAAVPASPGGALSIDPAEAVAQVLRQAARVQRE